MNSKLVWCAALGVLAALFCTACPDASGTSGTDPSSQSAMLAAYGINEVAARSQTDPQPLGTKVSFPLSRRQIATSGLSYEASTAPRLIDFKGSTATTLYTGINDSWTTNPHCSVAAQVGGNGKESLVSIVFVPDSTNYAVGALTGTVRLIVWDGVESRLVEPFAGGKNETFTLYLSAWGGNWYYQLNNELSAAAGDMNSDGIDEIGFCIGNRFVILDGTFSGVLYDGYVTGSGTVDTDSSTIHPSRVAAGDLFGDGRISFVTTSGSAALNAVGYYRVFGGAKPGLIASGTLSGGTCPLSLMYANVAIADIDGDGRNELVFAGRQDLVYNSLNLVVANLDAGVNSLSFWDVSLSLGLDGTVWGSHPLPALAAFNPDSKTGDTSADILFVYDSVYRYNKEKREFSKGYKGFPESAVPLYTNVFASDVDYDSQEDLVLLSSSGGVGIEVYSLGSGNSFKRSVLPALVSPADHPFMNICGVDVVGESVVLKYEGTNIIYSDPTIVAVLAAAPFYSSGENSTGTTALSLYEQTSIEEASSFTISASISVGTSVDCPLWGKASAMEVTHTLGSSFTYGFSASTTFTCKHGYSTNGDKDAVLLSCIPFDIYEYLVLNSPNPEMVGETVFVSVPRTPQVILMEMAVYNALPGNPARIGSSILPHTAGVPSSYRDYDTLLALCGDTGGLMDTKGTSSPIGATLETDSSVSVEKGSGTSLGAGLSLNSSMEVTILGALFGAELGFESTYDYSVSTSSATEISTAVSGTSGQSAHFEYGAAAYNVLDESIQSIPFMVVTCWVGRD